ncbi:MAG: PfkB family carbohydrate kinase, partial [Oscillospiraceae bacterium]
MSKKFLATGLNMVDKLVWPDGRKMTCMGGIPMYGFAGMRFWTGSSRDIAFGARVGKNFRDYYDPWFTDNGIDDSDLITVSDDTPYNTIYYEEDESVGRCDFFTGDFKDAVLWRPHGEDFRRWIGPETVGMYVCSGADDPMWPEVFSLKEKYGFKIMWEPNYINTFENSGEATKKLLGKIDMASFNVVEGSRLFGASSEEDLLKKLEAYDNDLILLRAGSKGMHVISGHRSHMIPSAKVPQGSSVVDVTGCGNTSTSGAFCARCQGD